MAVDVDRVRAAVSELLSAIGEDPERDGLVNTPVRVAAMYEELFSGLHDDPARHLEVTFAAEHDEMVMVRDIPFASRVSTTWSRSSAGPTWRTSRPMMAASPGCRNWPAWSTATPAGCRSKSA